MRRDRLGRRVGHNWWREYNMSVFTSALLAVESHREDNHQMEPEEYAHEFPLPRLKDILVHNKGMRG